MKTPLPRPSASRLRLALLSAAFFPLAHGAPSADAPRPGRDYCREEHKPEIAKLAAAHRLSPEALTHALRTDPTLWVSARRGRLIHACPGIHADEPVAIPAATASVTSTTTVSAASAINDADAFRLHSLPGATRTIYLDFDGHTVSGTDWNTDYTAGASFVVAPYDTDGASATFGATERQTIIAIWRRIADDFAPFNVDVTTEEPPAGGLSRIGDTDLTYGVRVLFTPTRSWLGNGADDVGGIAYLNSFVSSDSTPAFVFYSASSGEKSLADAASHEIGHSFALSHDGQTDGTKYYGGHDNWGPIMGFPTSRAITQWSKGEYPLANNTQDDIAVIAVYAPLLADDHGSTLATATTVAPTSTTVGLIERREDIDFFRITCGPGEILINCSSLAPDPNLHRVMRLYDSAGNVLGTTRSSYLDRVSLYRNSSTGGTFYISVEGVGQAANAFNTVGYSDYGSLGEYVLGITAPPAGDPDLVLHYTFDEGAGTTISDSAKGGNNHTTIVSGAQWTSSGKFGAAYGHATTFPSFFPENQTDLDFNPRGDAFSISLWVKLSGTTGYRTLFSKGGTTTASRQYQVWTGTNSSSLVGFSGGSGSNALAATPALSDGNWHLVTFVNYNDAGTWRTRVYYDNGDAFVEFAAGANGKVSHLLRIGEVSTNWNRMNGFIDDLRVYKRALTQAEVAQLHAGTNPVKP